MNYVLGFLFTHDKRFVALIEKTKPEDQAGLLNGVGGKMDQGPDESPNEAMIREFREETGYGSINFEWDQYLMFNWSGGGIHVFRAYLPEGVQPLDYPMTKQPDEEETPSWFYVEDILELKAKCMNNLPMFIHMALSGYRGEISTR